MDFMRCFVVAYYSIWSWVVSVTWPV